LRTIKLFSGNIQRKRNHAATKGKSLIVKGSAGMKKRMKYDGTDKYKGFLACLYIILRLYP